MNPYRENDQELLKLTDKCRACTWFNDPCKKDPRCCDGPFERHRHSALFKLMRCAEAVIESAAAKR